MGYIAEWAWMFLGSSNARTCAGPAKSRRVRSWNRQTASLSVGRGADIFCGVDGEVQISRCSALIFK